MKHCKEILRLLHTGTTVRNISSVLHVSPNTVQRIKHAMNEKGIKWVDIYDMTEEEINKFLFPKTQDTNTELDFRLEHMTLSKTAKETWKLYYDNELLAGHKPVGYSMFCKLLKKQKKKVKNYKSDFFPGAEIFCLLLPEKAETETGTFRIFLIMLPYSHYVSLIALDGNETTAWCKACATFFIQVGGSTSAICTISGKTVIWGNEIRKPVQNICLQFKTALHLDNTLKIIAKTASERLQELLSGCIFHDHNELQTELERIYMAHNLSGSPSPDDVYRLLEAYHLSPLPEKREYIWGTAKVGFDCHVQVNNVLYSVPYTFCKKTVTVKIIGNQIEFYTNKNSSPIATHRLHTNSAKRFFYVTNSDHLPPPGAQMAWDRSRIINYAFDKGGLYLKEYIAELMNQYSYEQQAYRRCLGIISLSQNYGKDAVNHACRQLLEECGSPSYTALKRRLEQINN